VDWRGLAPASLPISLRSLTEVRDCHHSQALGTRLSFQLKLIFNFKSIGYSRLGFAHGGWFGFRMGALGLRGVCEQPIRPDPSISINLEHTEEVQPENGDR
jgi:hypothetical protein